MTSPVSVASRVSTLRCAVCHDGLDGERTACRACASAFHAACRMELGRCPTLGCRYAGKTLARSWTAEAWRDEPPVPPRVSARTAYTAFELFFGVALPIVCLAFDPIIFRDGFFGRGGSYFGIGEYRTPCYAFMASQMAALVLSWILQPRRRWLRSIFAIVFALGGAFALALGTFMLPVSAVGIIFFGIGLLGFTPFFTSFVFLRQAVRLFRAVDPS